MQKIKHNSGVAALLTVFVLGLISLLIGVSLLQTGYDSSLRGRNQAGSLDAFYAAQSGMEEAILQIGTHGYGWPAEQSFTLNVDAGTADVRVWGDSEDQRYIESVGTYGNKIRKITAEIQNTTLKPGFANAIHAGAGGIELRNQTLVTSKDGSGGNIYSNNFIKGAKNDFTASSGDCKNAASAVDGSVWAHTFIDKLGTNDSGVCVLREAHAENLNFCYAKDGLFSPNSPLASCPTLGTYTNEPAPDIIPLPNMGVDNLKYYLNAKGSIWSGDCVADGSGNSTDCTNGTFNLGNIIVTGTLTKPSNVDLRVTGPVWIKEDITFESLGSIKPATNITDVSQIILSDGIITSESNMTYGKNVNAYLLLISTYDPGVDTDQVCNEESGVASAITISSNSESVLFYSMHGCVKVNANSQFHGALLGEGIRVDNNSNVEYDPDLQTAIFGLTSDGGWKVVDFMEE